MCREIRGRAEKRSGEERRKEERIEGVSED
jgi:hypothetical protein